MARVSEQMERLIELKERLLANIAQHQKAIEAFQNQLLGVEMSMRSLGAAAGANPAPRRNVKKTVLEIIHEAGRVGVTATEVRDRATAKGRMLNANSVASLLSRFKQDGVLTFDGERYNLVSHASANESPPLKVVRTNNGA
jgi:hypothetical protein